jgi:hypothetical protein
MATIPTALRPPSRDQQSFLAGGMMIVLAIALAKLVFHIYFNNRYGYFRNATTFVRRFSYSIN